MDNHRKGEARSRRMEKNMTHFDPVFTKHELLPAPPPPWLEGDQIEIWNFFEEAKIKCVKKNLDYGSSVFKSPRLKKSMSPGDAILVRICDKLERLENLMNAPSPEGRMVKDESIEDTCLDAGVYFFLYLINKKRKER